MNSTTPEPHSSHETHRHKLKSNRVVDKDHLRSNHIYLSGDDVDSKIAISAYKRLRTTVLTSMAELGINTVMITGATANIGKTTTAINLAINIARHPNMKVLLVDLDLRASTMADTLGIKSDYGSERMMDSNFDMKRAAIYLNDIADIWVIPCTRRLENSTEALLSPGMLDLFSKFRQLPDEYIVLYDTPPILGCDDVSALLPHMQSTILLVEEGGTSKREFKQAYDTVERLPLLNVVLNKSHSNELQKYYY